MAAAAPGKLLSHLAERCQRKGSFDEILEQLGIIESRPRCVLHLALHKLPVLFHVRTRPRRGRLRCTARGGRVA
eukprot:scaffold126661_cov28-Tisochrysis_lutea.AAC.4